MIVQQGFINSLVDKIVDGALILIIVFGVIHWIYNMREMRKAARVLSSVEAKGYEWANKPWHVKNTYISAKRVNVTSVGHSLDGMILYKADTGQNFFWNNDISHIVVDIFGRIHISKDKMALLAIEGPDLIICPNTFPVIHIIKDSKEASDFLEFDKNFARYNNQEYPFRTHYKWDAEPLDEKQLDAICFASQDDREKKY